MKCRYCENEVVWDKVRGWVHCSEAWTEVEEEMVYIVGGAYAMYCPSCNWEGTPFPSPIECPVCGNTKIKDDHCALSKRS